MEKLHRTFIAFELSPETRTSLLKYQQQLKRQGFKYRWISPENLHMTLAFLGDLSIRRVAQAAVLIQDKKRSLKPLNVKLTGISGFPKPESSKIVYAKLGGSDVKQLLRFVGEVRRDLLERELAFDSKPFVPHVTIGRSKIKQDLSSFQDKQLHEEIILEALGVFVTQYKESVLEYVRITDELQRDT